MAPSTSITLRPPTPADVPALADIAHRAFATFHTRHGFEPDIPSAQMAEPFLGMMCTHSASFGVVAECDGKIVGSNFLDERDPIRGVGPITVDPSAQCRGAGRRLMQAVVERGQGAQGIRLVQDAFNTASMSLYASLGFIVREPLALMRGQPKQTTINGTVRPIHENDLEECAVLAKAVTGFERTNELRDALPHHNPMLLERNGRIVAYASCPYFWIPNHGIAECEEALQALLCGAAAAANQPVWFLLPTRHDRFFRWALEQGLRMLKPMTLMTIGAYVPPRGGFFPSVAY